MYYEYYNLYNIISIKYLIIFSYYYIMLGLSKKRFCRSAKARSLKRPRVVRRFRKASTHAHKLRSKHLNEYCKDAHTKADKKFCKTAKKMSVKPFF